MKKIKETIKAFLAIPFVKYGVVLVIGVVLIGFVGSNSIWGHFRNKMRISELKDEIEHYEGEYRMEKVARERFFMKTDEEDIFVLSDDQREFQQKNSKDETIE